MKHKPVKMNEILKRENKKNCQRCGDGTYMSQHNQNGKIRFYCGKCHMTIFE